jgi:hypothetical protein
LSSKETVEVNYRGLMLTVTGSYYKGRPMVMYLRNGDPGYPEEPPEFEIDKIELNGEDITDFFDGLEHVRTIDRKKYWDDCYVEIENLCLEEIEGGEGYESDPEED